MNKEQWRDAVLDNYSNKTRAKAIADVLWPEQFDEKEVRFQKALYEKNMRENIKNTGIGVALICKLDVKLVVEIIAFIQKDKDEFDKGVADRLQERLTYCEWQAVLSLWFLTKNQKTDIIKYIMREAGLNTPAVENRKESMERDKDIKEGIKAGLLMGVRENRKETKMNEECGCKECTCETVQTKDLKYKVGDAVYIKPWNLMVEQFGLTQDGLHIKCLGGFTAEMEQTIKPTNRVVVITQIIGDAYRGRYSDGINFPFFVTDDMILSYAFEYGDTCYTTATDDAVKFLYYAVDNPSVTVVQAKDARFAADVIPYAKPPKTEVTKEQIAEKFGCAVSDLIIKETK